MVRVGRCHESDRAPTATRTHERVPSRRFPRAASRLTFQCRALWAVDAANAAEIWTALGERDFDDDAAAAADISGHPRRHVVQRYRRRRQLERGELRSLASFTLDIHGAGQSNARHHLLRGMSRPRTAIVWQDRLVLGCADGTVRQGARLGSCVCASVLNGRN